jgi:hypothetical protein
MENSLQNKTELRELRTLVERIKRGNCVLVLGPRVAIRANDPDRQPLDELLACDLLASIGAQGSVPLLPPVNLRRAADLYYSQRKDRVDLELAVQDFSEHEAGSTTDFHRDLAQLPFRLCVSASPDSLMLTAFEEANKSPQKGYYSFKQATNKQAINARLSDPTPGKPLVYYLFGHHEDPRSLVLTEGDLIEFLVSVVRGTPPIPDQVRSILADGEASFLFLGFGFHNWYLRVLLHVMNVYGRPNKAFAFEDAQFFNHPEHEQAVGFFSGERLIDFRPLRWEAFARHLREAYEASTPRKTLEATSIRESPPPNAPRAFLSYASEDRTAVEELAETLEVRGIRVWQDKQDLRAGDDWNRVLLEVIAKRVDYVIVVQTPAMTTAMRGVFHREIDAALQRQAEMGEFEGQKLRFLVPVKIGACAPLSSLERLHVIDVSEPDGVDSLVKSILEDWDRRAAFKSRP